LSDTGETTGDLEKRIQAVDHDVQNLRVDVTSLKHDVNTGNQAILHAIAGKSSESITSTKQKESLK